jgi:hypothetical protein
MIYFLQIWEDRCPTHPQHGAAHSTHGTGPPHQCGDVGREASLENPKAPDQMVRSALLSSGVTVALGPKVIDAEFPARTWVSMSETRKSLDFQHLCALPDNKEVVGKGESV